MAKQGGRTRMTASNVSANGRWTWWILGIVAALIVTGIAAGGKAVICAARSEARLEAHEAAQMRTETAIERRLERIEAKLDQVLLGRKE